MKYLALPLLLFFASHGVKAQEPEDFLGKFKGSEDIEWACTKDDVTTRSNETRTWEADYTEADGNRFKGEMFSGGDKYSMEGSVKGVSEVGRATGQDNDGNQCDIEFMGLLNGDELNLNTLGTCPSKKCTFKSKINATRQ